MYKSMVFGPGRHPLSELDAILNSAASMTTIPTDLSHYEAVIFDAQGNAAHVVSEPLAGDASTGRLEPVSQERAKQLLQADHRTVFRH
jgi:hypothetical protein